MTILMAEVSGVAGEVKFEITDGFRREEGPWLMTSNLFDNKTVLSCFVRRA